MNPLLVEGLTDACGFLVGVLLAWGLARLIGFDPAGAGYGAATIGGLALLGIGGGLGLQAARAWRARQKAAKASKD